MVRVFQLQLDTKNISALATLDDFLFNLFVQETKQTAVRWLIVLLPAAQTQFLLTTPRGSAVPLVQMVSENISFVTVYA